MENWGTVVQWSRETAQSTTADVSKRVGMTQPRLDDGKDLKVGEEEVRIAPRLLVCIIQWILETRLGGINMFRLCHVESEV